MSMSCGLIGAQNPTEETKKDLEFNNMIENANKNVSKNGEVQQSAVNKKWSIASYGMERE